MLEEIGELSLKYMKQRGEIVIGAGTKAPHRSATSATP